MRIRLFAGLSALVLIVALTACGGNAAPTTTASTPPPATPTPTTPTTTTPPATTPPTTTPPTTTPPTTTPPTTPTPAPPSSSCNYAYSTFKDASGADAKFIYGNNDNGAMVGQDSTGRGFIFQNGQFTFPTPPASWSAANNNVNPTAIANNDLVAGTYATGSQPNVTTHAFIYNNGQWTTFDAPNSNATSPTGISSDGTVVGARSSLAIYGSDWIRHPDGTLASLDDGSIPGGLRLPGDIDDNGVVVLSATSSQQHQNQYATWQNGTFTYHDFPQPDLIIAPNGNNNLGDIVGQSQTNDVSRSWALLGSTLCTIAYPNATQTVAQDINGSRVIVGYYTTGTPGSAGFAYHAFVATPK